MDVLNRDELIWLHLQRQWHGTGWWTELKTHYWSLSMCFKHWRHEAYLAFDEWEAVSRGGRASGSRAFGGSGLWGGGCWGGLPIKRIYPLKRQKKKAKTVENWREHKQGRWRENKGMGERERKGEGFKGKGLEEERTSMIAVSQKANHIIHHHILEMLERCHGNLNNTDPLYASSTTTSVLATIWFGFFYDKAQSIIPNISASVT